MRHANLDLAGFGATNPMAGPSPFAAFLQGAPEAQGLDMRAETRHSLCRKGGHIWKVKADIQTTNKRELLPRGRKSSQIPKRLYANDIVVAQPRPVVPCIGARHSFTAHLRKRAGRDAFVAKENHLKCICRTIGELLGELAISEPTSSNRSQATATRQAGTYYAGALPRSCRERTKARSQQNSIVCSAGNCACRQITVYFGTCALSGGA